MRTKLTMLILLFGLGMGMSTQANSQVYYQKAVGVRLAWGLGLSGKYFLNDKAAIEANFRYRSFGSGPYSWNWVTIQALYEIHNGLESVTDGLQWYYGGGAYLGFYGGDFDYPGSDFNGTFIGISGVLGLDYKFADLPINISADWMPSFEITSGGGFTGENGGLAVRYTFGD